MISCIGQSSDHIGIGVVLTQHQQGSGGRSSSFIIIWYLDAALEMTAVLYGHLCEMQCALLFDKIHFHECPAFIRGGNVNGVV